MTPEQITVSLEWARKLKEAGYPQATTHCCWCISGGGGKNKYRLGEDILRCRGQANSKMVAPIAAPTAEEILRRLPRTLDEWNLDCLPNPDDTTWAVSYFSAVNVEQHTHPAIQEILPCEHDTLADAAAAMYCFLADHKLLP